MPEADVFQITKDDLSALRQAAPVFVTFGEAMVRDTPADFKRPERPRLVRLWIRATRPTLRGAQRSSSNRCRPGGTDSAEHGL